MTYKSEFQLAVPIAQIEIGELTQSPQNVSAIAASLGECGLLHPITVPVERRPVRRFRNIHEIPVVGWA